ncbi:antitoxin VapB family protein [Halorubrum sp. CSM-61]|uniref:antitoxin VapB family protein n=1 Tax=Halorubrum sp. CSM-61 TaxID=2485838 RepID=UPI000F4B52F2|nr:antitoxin VapB family protein [Halorubrum sp. CSM-61]
MSTRNVRIDDDVYERIKREKRTDEMFFEAVKRLIGGRSFLDLAGILNDDEADYKDCTLPVVYYKIFRTTSRSSSTNPWRGVM